MNPTYGLIRVSTLTQKDNTSLENQTKKIKDYCKVYDFVKWSKTLLLLIQTSDGSIKLVFDSSIPFVF